MEQILSLTMLVEPDRQRFTRFVVEAVRELGGNAFTVAPKLVGLLDEVRRECERAEGPLPARIAVEGDGLFALCGERRVSLCRLPAPPPAAALTALAERLRRQSETADPELLRRRNQEIRGELEKAKHRAAAELAELEAALERKKEQLQRSMHQAETDGLTGLFNRAAYDRRLEEAVVRSLRQEEALSLVLLDVDKFKRINDTHGHQYGDNHLRRVADAIRQAVREGVDYGFRYGGDEFAVLVHAEVDVAQRIAGAVLNLMSGGISAGVAELRSDDTPQRLGGRADEALYAAKNQGRGRVVVAQSG